MMNKNAKLLAAFAVLAVAFAAFAVIPAVAEDSDAAVESGSVASIGDTGYTTLQAAINAASGETTVKLLANVAESVSVNSGSTIILDLNGKTITAGKNSSSVYAAAITNNGTLTVVDNSKDGTGAVINNSNEGTKAAVFFNGDNGIAYLNGGTFSKLNDGTKNSYYVVKNMGTMTINGAKFYMGTTAGAKTDDYVDSMIVNGSYNINGKDAEVTLSSSNKASLTIESGTFEGGMNTVKNDYFGETTINGGTFKNTIQAVLFNLNKMEVTGGTFTADYQMFATAKVLVRYGVTASDGASSGELTITGGTFNYDSSEFSLVERMGAGWDTAKVDDKGASEDNMAQLGTITIDAKYTDATVKVKAGCNAAGSVTFVDNTANPAVNNTITLQNVKAGDSPIIFSVGSIEISGTIVAGENVRIDATSGEVKIGTLTITSGNAAAHGLKIDVSGSTGATVVGKLTVPEGSTLEVTNGTLAIGPKATLAVGGEIKGNFDNEGTIAITKETAKIGGANVSGSGTVDTSAVTSEGTISGSFDTNTTFTKNQIITVTGDVTLVKGTVFIFEGTLIIPDGMKFIVEEGAQLIIKDATGKLENNGTIVIESNMIRTAGDYTTSGGFIVTGGSKVFNNGTVTLDYTAPEGVEYGDALRIQNNGYFENKGTVTVGDDSALIIQGAESVVAGKKGTLINASGATLDIDGFFTIRYGGELKNAGLVSIDATIVDATGGTSVYISMTAADAEVDIISLTANYGGLNLIIEDSEITQFKKAGDLFNDDVNNANSVTITPNSTAISANPAYKYTVDGLVVKSVIVKNDFTSIDETHDYIKNLDISGNVTSNDVSETPKDRGTNDTDVSVAVKGFNTVTTDLSVGKYVNFTIDDVAVQVHNPESEAVTAMNVGLFVTGTVTVVDGATFGLVAADDSLFVTGKITVENGTIGNAGDYISAAYYKVAKTATTAELNIYTTFSTAIADGATKITLTGLNYPTEDITVPSGTTVENKGILVIADETKVNFAQGSVLKNAGMSVGSPAVTFGIVVKGVLYIEDVKGTLKSGSDKIISEVVINGETDRTYCGLAYALANSKDGDVIKLSGNVEVTKDLTIPAGVTVDTNKFDIYVDKNATLTVDGTLFINGSESQVTVERTTVEGNKDGKITVNGVVKSDNVIDPALKIFSGAYYSISEGANTTYFVEPVENAVTKIADADADEKGVNVTVYNFEDAALKVSDITVTGKSADEPAIIAFMCDVVIKSITLENAGVGFANGKEVNAVITSSVGSIAINGVSGVFSAASVIVDGTTAFGFGGVFENFSDSSSKKYAFNVTGEVYIGESDTDGVGTTCDIYKITVDGTLIVSDYSTENIHVDKLVVNGTLSVPSKSKIDIDTAEVYGTFAVVAATPEAQAGQATVDDLFVGISAKNSTRTLPVGATGAVTGPIDVTNKAVVAAGSTVPESFADEKHTEYYVEGALYVTAYDFNTTSTVAINVIKASVPNSVFVQWNDDNGEKVENSVMIGDEEKVTAKINYEIYGVGILICDGIGSVTIDGNLYDYGYVPLKAGTHTIEYTVKNGYTGTAKLAINGSVLAGECTVSGMSFTLSGDLTAPTNAVTLQLTGIEKSGYVPDSPDTDNGMTITDYLLIVLVVLIIVMAIIVAMRMMRS